MHPVRPGHPRSPAASAGGSESQMDVKRFRRTGHDRACHAVTRLCEQEVGWDRVRVDSRSAAPKTGLPVPRCNCCYLGEMLGLGVLFSKAIDQASSQPRTPAMRRGCVS